MTHATNTGRSCRVCALITLSATGREKEVGDDEVFRLEPEDYKDNIVGERLGAAKRLRLQEVEDAKTLVACDICSFSI